MGGQTFLWGGGGGSRGRHDSDSPFIVRNQKSNGGGGRPMEVGWQATPIVTPLVFNYVKHIFFQLQAVNSPHPIPTFPKCQTEHSRSWYAELEVARVFQVGCYIPRCAVGQLTVSRRLT